MGKAISPRGDMPKNRVQFSQGRSMPAIYPLFPRRLQIDWRSSAKAFHRLAAVALHDYKSGLRSGGGVAAMAEAAHPLSDDEIAALGHYLARL